jgi:hypothetical protein
LAQEFERIGKAEGKKSLSPVKEGEASSRTVAMPKEGRKAAPSKRKSGELLT